MSNVTQSDFTTTFLDFRTRYHDARKRYYVARDAGDTDEAGEIEIEWTAIFRDYCRWCDKQASAAKRSFRLNELADREAELKRRKALAKTAPTEH
jgi:hypothetical protein